MKESKHSKWVSGFCNVAETGGGLLASVAWLVVALITVIDVIGRAVFSMPIYGAYEYVKIFMAFGLFFSIPSVVLHHRQVNVQLFSHLLRKQHQKNWANFGALVGAGCFGIVTFALARLTKSFFHSGETTTLLELPLWTVSAFMCFMSGFIVLSCIVSLWITQNDEGELDV